MKLHDFPNLDPLVASLLARAPRMNFMQLCRLFEVRFPDQPGFGTQDMLEHEPVRFRPRPRMGFPASDVASVEFDDGSDTFGPGSRPTVRTTFMGLYGVDAAMPSHLIDEIVLREEGHEAVEAFLDQFNHRYVTLLYRAWRKYRYPEHFRPGGIDAHSRNLLCLAGFGWGDKPQRAGLPDSRMLALLGLLIQRTRTPEGLAGAIALAIPRVEVRVDEFWPVVTSTGRPRALTGAGRATGRSGTGRRNGLGGGYVLGKRMAYRSRAVRVTLRPADARQAQDLLPGGGAASRFDGLRAVICRCQGGRTPAYGDVVAIHAGAVDRAGKCRADAPARLDYRAARGRGANRQYCARRLRSVSRDGAESIPDRIACLTRNDA